LVDGVIKIAKQEKLSGFYRGVGAAALGSSISWAIYLPAYLTFYLFFIFSSFLHFIDLTKSVTHSLKPT